MSKVEIKLDKKGMTEFLQSSEIAEEIKRVAEQQADSDHHLRSFIGFDRAKTIIYPNTRKHPE